MLELNSRIICFCNIKSVYILKEYDYDYDIILFRHKTKTTHHIMSSIYIIYKCLYYIMSIVLVIVP